LSDDNLFLVLKLSKWLFCNFTIQIQTMIYFAPAKINIGLKVLNKRPDSYHNIDTIFYPIPLHDILEFVKSDDFEMQTTGLEVGGDLESNLVYKAYQLIKSKFQIEGVRIHLHKIIPMGAGLGGGSSDAALTLIALNQLFNLNLDKETLAQYALTLGADCPFFIYQKPLRATQTGAVFSNVEMNLSGKYIVLIKPEIHISTAEAYSGVHLEGEADSLDLSIVNQPELWKAKYINSFENHLFKKYPLLKELKDSLYNQGAIYASMSGSGSTLFGIFDSEPMIRDEWKKHFVFSKKL